MWGVIPVARSWLGEQVRTAVPELVESTNVSLCFHGATVLTPVVVVPAAAESEPSSPSTNLRNLRSRPGFDPYSVAPRALIEPAAF